MLLVPFADNSSISNERTHTQVKPKEAHVIVLSNFEEDQLERYVYTLIDHAYFHKWCSLRKYMVSVKHCFDLRVALTLAFYPVIWNVIK